MNPDLHYCNSCGFRLQGGSGSDGGSIAESLAKAVGWIGVVGLITFVFVLAILFANAVDPGVVVVVSFFYLGAVFAICSKLLSNIKSVRGTDSSFPKSSKETPGELSPANTNQLEPAKTPPASVTDHTTRTLDKVPLERD